MNVTPTLTKRAEHLGWIASTPDDYELRFAVVGDTEIEALAKFEEALVRWESLPDD